MNNLLRTRVPIGYNGDDEELPEGLAPATMAAPSGGPVPIAAPAAITSPAEESKKVVPIGGAAPKTPIGNPRLEADQAELQRLKSTGSGIDQLSQKPGFWHKAAGVAARIGDIAGSALFPTVTGMIPGTQFHHNALVNQAQGNVATDVEQEKQEADIAKTNAEAKNLETPDDAAAAKTVETGDGVYQWNPDTKKYDIPVGPGKGKPKGIEEQAYEFALKSGKSPLDALSAVYGAKSPKDAALPQQYLDAISTGDSVKANLIKRAIHDTNTAPKIEVNAAGAAAKGEKENNSRLDKSYQFNAGALTKIADPVEQQASRMGRLQQTIDQATPQADALVAPELLTVMAGGAGSGLRMNEAEISRVVGGRSNFESIKASLNKWQADPSKALSITPAQRQQIKTLLTEVSNRLVQKRQVVEEANQALIEAEDVKQHRQIVAGARKALADIDSGTYKPKAEAGGHGLQIHRDASGRIVGFE